MFVRMDALSKKVRGFPPKQSLDGKPIFVLEQASFV
jgi:hypothetical protein